MNATETATFDRDRMAQWYAALHMKTDPGVRAVYYLPTGAPEREIRLLEVNDLIAEMKEADLEPFDFGVDTGSADAHALHVLDVTPVQWDRIHGGKLALPAGWSLAGAVEYGR